MKNVWFFNMDEYLIAPDKELDRNDKMSFHKRMNDEFYSKIDEELIMPENQRLFPEVGIEYSVHIQKPLFEKEKTKRRYIAFHRENCRKLKLFTK